MTHEISSERKKYLFQKRKNKFLIILTQILILLAFIIVWEWLAEKEIIDDFITSRPSKILLTLGVLIATILWWSNFISKVSEPFLVVLNSLPKVALGPIIIVWVGAGEKAIITMALAISLIVTILEMLNGFLRTDSNFIKMAQTFNANKFQIFTKVVLPSNISTLINALKVNIGLSLVGVISGEFLVSKAGLGYLIVYGGQVFKLDLVMTSVIILALVATAMYQGIVLLEKLISKFIMHKS